MKIQEFLTECIDQNGDVRKFLIMKRHCSYTGKPYVICDVVGRKINPSSLEVEDLYRIDREAELRLGN